MVLKCRLVSLKQDRDEWLKRERDERSASNEGRLSRQPMVVGREFHLATARGTKLF